MTVLVQLLGPCAEVDAVRDQLRDRFGPCIQHVESRTYPDGGRRGKSARIQDYTCSEFTAVPQEMTE